MELGFRSDIKQNLNPMPCLACFCNELSWVGFGDQGTCCTLVGTACCIFGSVGLDCGTPCRCCALRCRDSCYTQEQGCCETSARCVCLYIESQFPPGKDIGCGCCGKACCRTSDDAPKQEEMAECLTDE